MFDTSDQTYRQLISAAAKLLLVDLSEDDVESPVAFQIDGTDVFLTLDTRGNGHAILFSVDLGLVDPRSELLVYRKFLEANLFWNGTGGATIGIEAESGRAHLCLRVGLGELDAQQVALTGAEMIDTARLWREVIEAANGACEAGTPSDDIIIQF